jgi:hypothetical protein
MAMSEVSDRLWPSKIKGLQILIAKYGKSSFLTIQLLLKFGFRHRTPKPVIFGHQTIKTVQIWPLGCFDGWF